MPAHGDTEAGSGRWEPSSPAWLWPRSSESPQFSRAVAAVDHVVESCRRQALTPAGFVGEVVDAFLEYLRHEDPRDEVMVLVEYCLDWARELSGLTLFADRVMVRDLEQRLAWCLERPALRLELDELMGRLDAGLRADDGEVAIELVELCRCGLDGYPRLFNVGDWVEEVLVLAHRHRVPTALAAAVRPSSPSRIAAAFRHDGGPYLLALDLLGQLAADPFSTVERRRLAQDELIDLCGYIGVAGEAALRLPAHRLDADQREQLVRAVEERVDRWPPGLPGDLFCTEAMREVDIVRTVAWQVADHHHARR